MLRTTAALISAAMLAACSPTFNWREVSAQPTALTAVLPCKPDKDSRNVPMAGRSVSLQAFACDSGGATFAVLFAELGDAGAAGDALGQWKAATLANMRSTRAHESPFMPAGALSLPQSVQVVATGQRADGTPVESHAAYFAHGRHVFQAVIYAGRLKPEMAEPFFSGIRLQ